jgi:hypothetical protein
MISHRRHSLAFARPCVVAGALLAWMLGGCAHRGGGERAPPSEPTWAPLGESAAVPDTQERKQGEARLAAAAESSVGASSMVVGGERFRFDCSGVVRGVFAKAGLGLEHDDNQLAPSDTAGIFAWVRRTGSLRRDHPRVGDLVFFDNTYDRNHDGIDNDWLSHVGVVQRIDDDDTVWYVHRTSAGIVRFAMNLSHPHTSTSPTGQAWNHSLRGGDGRTGAELFVAFGSPLHQPLSTSVSSAAVDEDMSAGQMAQLLTKF